MNKQVLVNKMAHRMYEKAIHSPKNQRLIKAEKQREQKQMDKVTQQTINKNKKIKKHLQTIKRDLTLNSKSKYSYDDLYEIALNSKIDDLSLDFDSFDRKHAYVPTGKQLIPLVNEMIADV